MAAPEKPQDATERSNGLPVLLICVVVFVVASGLAHLAGGRGGRGVGDEIGILLGAGLTLIMFSFLYRDNPLFKIAENLYVGVGVGYLVVIEWFSIMKVEVYDPFRYAPTRAMLLYAIQERIIPIILGLLLITRLWNRVSWLSRYTYAILVGWGCGIGIATSVDSFLLSQLEATVRPVKAGLWPHVGAVFILIGTVTVLFYFFFSVEHKGPGRAVSRVGIWFLMLAFGASFGYTVMARISLLIGRLQFLLGDWLGIKL